MYKDKIFYETVFVTSTSYNIYETKLILFYANLFVKDCTKKLFIQTA